MAELLSTVGSQIMQDLSEKATDVLASGVQTVASVTGVKEWIEDKCVTGIAEKVGLGHLVQYTPLIKLMFEMNDNAPKPSGNPVEDDLHWADFVDKYVLKFKAVTGKSSLTEFFQDESLMASLKNVYGLQDTSFLHDENQLMLMLKSTRSINGLVEKFLSVPLKHFADHSFTVEDRFKMYLPEFISQLGANVGVRVVGDVSRQPSINLNKLRIVGFALYDGSDYKAAEIAPNPLEQLRTDFGRLLKYYGAGNPIPNDLPVNDVDVGGFVHDFGYTFPSGYNTPHAKIVDKQLVEHLKKGIDSGKLQKQIDRDVKQGKITAEEGTHLMDVARKGMLYFSVVDVK